MAKGRRVVKWQREEGGDTLRPQLGPRVPARGRVGEGRECE